MRTRIWLSWTVAALATVQSASASLLAQAVPSKYNLTVHAAEPVSRDVVVRNLGEGPAIGIGDNDGTALIFSHQQGVWLSGGVLHADNSAKFSRLHTGARRPISRCHINFAAALVRLADRHH